MDYLTSPVSQKVESWTHYNEWGEITHNAVLKMGLRELDLVKNYTGHDYDAVLNLYYAKARMYDAENRRFLSIDPILDGTEYDLSEYVYEVVNFTAYLYVRDNPLRWVDPLGLKSVSLDPYASYTYLDGNGWGGYTLGTSNNDNGTGKETQTNPASPSGNSTAVGKDNVAQLAETNQLDDSDKGIRFVGFGIQIEVSLSIFSMGLELVFYTDDQVRANGNKLGIVRNHYWEPYPYTYYGVGKSSELNESLISIVSALQQTPTLLNKISGLSRCVPKGVSISLTVFAIIGNSAFKTPEDYTGPFAGGSVTVNHIKSFIAVGSTCTTFGAGLSSTYFSVGGCASDYDLLGNGQIDYALFKGLAEIARPMAEAIPIN